MTSFMYSWFSYTVFVIQYVYFDIKVDSPACVYFSLRIDSINSHVKFNLLISCSTVGKSFNHFLHKYLCSFSFPTVLGNGKMLS